MFLVIYPQVGFEESYALGHLFGHICAIVTGIQRNWYQGYSIDGEGGFYACLELYDNILLIKNHARAKRVELWQGDMVIASSEDRHAIQLAAGSIQFHGEDIDRIIAVLRSTRMIGRYGGVLYFDESIFHAAFNVHTHSRPTPPNVQDMEYWSTPTPLQQHIYRGIIGSEPHRSMDTLSVRVFEFSGQDTRADIRFLRLLEMMQGEVLAGDDWPLALYQADITMVGHHGELPLVQERRLESLVLGEMVLLPESLDEEDQQEDLFAQSSSIKIAESINVLFVCCYGLERSPMAAALLELLSGDLRGRVEVRYGGCTQKNIIRSGCRHEVRESVLILCVLGVLFPLMKHHLWLDRRYLYDDRRCYADIVFALSSPAS